MITWAIWHNIKIVDSTKYLVTFFTALSSTYLDVQLLKKNEFTIPVPSFYTRYEIFTTTNMAWKFGENVLRHPNPKLYVSAQRQQ